MFGAGTMGRGTPSPQTGVPKNEGTEATFLQARRRLFLGGRGRRDCWAMWGLFRVTKATAATFGRDNNRWMPRKNLTNRPGQVGEGEGGGSNAALTMVHPIRCPRPLLRNDFFVYTRCGPLPKKSSGHGRVCTRVSPPVRGGERTKCYRSTRRCAHSRRCPTAPRSTTPAHNPTAAFHTFLPAQ
jgi:hypothetical protein